MTKGLQKEFIVKFIGHRRGVSITESQVSFVQIVGKYAMVQLKDSAQAWVCSHDKNEYLVFDLMNGYAEVEDIIEAKNKAEATERFLNIRCEFRRREKAKANFVELLKKAGNHE